MKSWLERWQELNADWRPREEPAPKKAEKKGEKHYTKAEWAEYLNRSLLAREASSALLFRALELLANDDLEFSVRAELGAKLIFTLSSGGGGYRACFVVTLEQLYFHRNYSALDFLERLIDHLYQELRNARNNGRGYLPVRR